MYIPKGIESRNSNRYLYTHVHGSIIDEANAGNNLNVHEQMNDKQNIVYIQQNIIH